MHYKKKKTYSPSLRFKRSLKKKKKKKRIFQWNTILFKNARLAHEIIRPNALLDYNEENGRLNNKTL